MNSKKVNILKTIGKVFNQAVKEGKTQFILLLIIGIVNCFSMYFGLLVPELATNIAYSFITEDNINFYQMIKPLIIVLVILFIFAIMQSVYGLLKIYVNRNLKTKYELGLSKKLSSMKWESYETHSVNMKIEMVKRDGVNSYLSIGFELVPWMINTIFYMIIYILVIARISVAIGFAFAASSVIYILIGIYCGNKIYKTYRNNDAIYKKRTYLYNCSKSKESHQDGIVNRLYHHLSKRWRKMNDDWNNDTIKASTRVTLYNLIPGFVFAIIACGLLYIVIKEIQNGDKEIGYFTLIITTIVNFRWTLQGLSSNISWYERDFNVHQDYLDLMKYGGEYPNTNEVLPDDYEIEFKEVEYIYPQSQHKALNNLNLKIQAHETIAIVGVNGSGKTTFVSMLMELSKNYIGDIQVNGKSLNDSIGILRNSCSCIFQDFLEYQFSVKENIALGDISREITDEEIWDILKSVGLYEFVCTLPNGIHTMLGQINNGIEISKGQWQRLAVARLLANTNSKIWVLDEPTAYLDPIGEIDMYNFIYDLKGDRTVIFISHRLGFAKKANRIIVFKDGKVIEDGNHDNLINDKNSEYAKMYDKQKKWYE